MVKFNNVNCDGMIFGSVTGWEWYTDRATPALQKERADWICQRYGFAQSYDHFVLKNTHFIPHEHTGSMIEWQLHEQLLFPNGAGGFQLMNPYFNPVHPDGREGRIPKNNNYGNYIQTVICFR